MHVVINQFYIYALRRRMNSAVIKTAITRETRGMHGREATMQQTGNGSQPDSSARGYRYARSSTRSAGIRVGLSRAFIHLKSTEERSVIFRIDGPARARDDRSATLIFMTNRSGSVAANHQSLERLDPSASDRA
jgi:hypothetical protein